MNPFDVVRSRLMNSSKGEGRYTGMLDCFFKSVRTEGILSLWKGFFPSYARIGPRVVIIFVLLEKMRETFDWSEYLFELEIIAAKFKLSYKKHVSVSLWK